MAKNDFEEDDFDEDEEETFDDEEVPVQSFKKPQALSKPKKIEKEDTIKAIKNAVSSPIEKQAEDEYYVYEQLARVGIGRRSNQKSLGENEGLIAGALVEMLNKLDRIEKNTG